MIRPRRVIVLLGKTQTSAISGTRRIRVLIASGDPERIMLVRESLHAWPEAMICRVAVNRDDAMNQFESHAPHILCWDVHLGAELPATARGISTLLLGDEACTLPEERPWGMALPDAYLAGLQRAINREYELRRCLVQLRDAHGSETHSRLLLNRATDGIVVLDGAHNVLFINPAACAMLGVDCEEMVGEPFEHPVPEEGNPASYQVDLPDGLRSHLAATSIASIWDGCEATILQLQPALRPSVPPSMPPPMVAPGVAEDRLRTVGRLAAGLAHEVNNPLTFVLANLESLRESHQVIRRFIRTLRVDLSTREAITPQSFERIAADANLQEVLDDAADMLTDCHKGMHRIQDIARSLGTFSRADDAQAEMIDITRIVDDACAMVFNQIRYRARLVKRFEPTPMIAAFPGRIAQALVNLLTNAADAIDGGAYDKHRIVVSTRMEGDEVVVAVTDTGAGIHKDDRARIFTPGFTTKAHEGGMGLGLSACIRVAKAHGGRLEVHHLADGGTRFELILPTDTGLPAVEPRRESRPISEAPLQRARILIIDDDAMVLSALHRRLRRRYDTVTVLGGVEALALLAEDPAFDSIVCDLMMPEVDGKSFYDSVKRDHPQLADRIVFMSGGAFTSRLRRFAAAVPNPVLQKPVSREDLESMLSAHGPERERPSVVPEA
ncbi:MAG: response regulator [Deltaproteobacteria bacterium]|nr:response regulator [Deltaproteobacteria bacterium]MBW2718628.1 response regulator [Deltaproteobacteria bacterium]